ncbi:uncharacterized protein METZ01_LOCUS447201, partial [marine metagenome]
MKLSSIKLNRLERYLILLVVYTGVLVLSYLLSYQIRWDFAVPQQYRGQLLGVWPIVTVVKLISLWYFGQFASLLTYFSLPDTRRVALALVLPSAGLLGLWYSGVGPINIGAGSNPDSVPRGVIIIDTMLSFAGVVFVRILFRMVRERDFRLTDVGGERKRVAIVGAGEVGARLGQELANKPRMAREVVVFFDD